MKAIFAIVLIGILGVTVFQMHSFFVRRQELKSQFGEVEDKLDQARADEEKFRAELDYYLNPANLEKELRARFNYKRPGEKLLIIVPRETTTTEKNNVSD